MAITLVALYRKPDDTDAFMRHYDEVHLPLVARIPHLVRTQVRRITGSPTGDTPYFLMVEMTFPDRVLYAEAMRSDANRAAGRDLMAFARGLVELMVVDDEP